MKIFRVNMEGEKELFFYRVTSLRKYLKEHPEIKVVIRDWWYHNDLIECDEFDRDKILNSKATKLTKGQTAQWAMDHHALNQK